MKSKSEFVIEDRNGFVYQGGFAVSSGSDLSLLHVRCGYGVLLAMVM